MEYNVIYVDDERNARPLVQDGRRPTGPGIFPGGRQPFGVRPPAGSVVVPPSTRPTVIAGSRYAAPSYQPSYQPTVVYQQAPGLPGFLGNVTISDLAELGLHVFAALRALPAAPTAQGDIETDVNNTVIYQTALAEFDQNSQRLRTLGDVVGRFLRK